MKAITTKKNSHKNIFFLLLLLLYPLLLSAQNTEGGLNTDLVGSYASESTPKLTDIINLHLSFDTVILLTLAILVITIIMHIIRRTLDEDEGFEGLQLPIFAFLFVTMCIFELMIAMSGINPVWFCSPADIGWFMSVIGFFFFVYILINQIKHFRLLMNNITIMDGYFYYGLPGSKYLTGILSAGIGIILLCLSGFADAGLIKNIFWHIAAIMVALQIVQAVIIYKNLITHAESFRLPRNAKNFKSDIPFADFMIRKDAMNAESEVSGKRGGTTKKYMISFIYLIGIIATTVTMIYFISLLFIAIVVIIGWAILFLMGKAQKSMGPARSSGPSYDERREKEITEGFSHMGHCESCIHYPGHASHCSHRGIVYSNTSSCMYYQRR